MKRTLFICDRCGVERESNELPACWLTLSIWFRIGVSINTFNYCDDCQPIVRELLEKKVVRILCGSINPGNATYLGGEKCARPTGHRGDHLSSSTLAHWGSDL